MINELDKKFFLDLFLTFQAFFHRSALEGIDFDELEEGNIGEFKLERGPKGLRAVNIRIIKI